MRLQRAWVLVLITLITVGFALATGHPMFWRSTYVFVALLAVAALWVWAMGRGVDVEVRHLSLRAQVGGSVRQMVLIRRHNRLQRGWLEVWEQTTMLVVPPIAIVDLDDATPVAIDLETPCPERGLFEIGPLTVASSDPFGAFQVRRRVGMPQELIVHPATVELPGFVLLPADLPGEGPRHVRSSHVTSNAYGIRDYGYGDGLNRISWKATAHHDRLMVKEFEVEPANNIWVLADLDRRAYPIGDRAVEDTVISVAASVCRRYVEVNYPVGFMAWGGQPAAVPPQRGPGQLVHILDLAAGLHATGGKSLLELIGDLQARAGRYTSVAIVTPSPSTEWLDGVGFLLHRRCRVTVVVVDAGAARPAGLTAIPSAQRAAGMGVPTYVVRKGEEKQGLTPLTPSAPAWAGN